ncbi:MAG: hypothetical protein RI894_505 [Bacteroidota bacterium]|jgi:hypothetical protein
MRPHHVLEKFIFATCLFCHITTTKIIGDKIRVLFLHGLTFLHLFFLKCKKMTIPFLVFPIGQS